MTSNQLIVVTGANGLVGAACCRELSSRGVPVRAVVRRPGSAPQLPGVEEAVGEFHQPDVAARLCEGAAAVINTVHPMRDSDLQRSATGWAATLAQAARQAHVGRFVHVSTTSVYERTAATGDVDEHSRLVDDAADEYAVTKRITEEGILSVDGLTRIIVRPTAICGPGATSVWNTVRPEMIRTDATARNDDPDRTYGFVHIQDLARLIADLATGIIALADDASRGPVAEQVTAVNAVSGNVTFGDYLAPVAEAVGVEPHWEHRDDAFRAKLLAERARAWGWAPTVTFEEAMAELLDGLRQRYGGA